MDPSGPPPPEQQRSDEQDDENDEQDLGDPGGGARDAEEAEESRYQRDDQKNDGVVQHGNPPCSPSAARTASLHPAGSWSISRTRQHHVTRVDAKACWHSSKWSRRRPLVRRARKTYVDTSMGNDAAMRAKGPGPKGCS